MATLAKNRGLVARFLCGGLFALALLSVPALAQDGETIETVKLADDKPYLVVKNTTKISLLDENASSDVPEDVGDPAYFRFSDADADTLTFDLSLATLDVFGRDAISLSPLNRARDSDVLLFSSGVDNSYTDGFSLALTSGIKYTMEDDALRTPNLVLAEDGELPTLTYDLFDRQYNVGLVVGFEGVVFDANYLERATGFQNSYQGLNLGLGYRANNWMTRLAVTGYTFNQNTDVNLLPEGVRQLYQFELGGAYRLSHRMSVTVGYKLTDYSRLLYDNEARWGQAFYLGGRFSY